MRNSDENISLSHENIRKGRDRAVCVNCVHFKYACLYLTIGILIFFRVGMLALASLGKRVSEDRPQAKFSKTPHYSDDVKWLMSVAKELGNKRITISEQTVSYCMYISM